MHPTPYAPAIAAAIRSRQAVEVAAHEYQAAKTCLQYWEQVMTTKGHADRQFLAPCHAAAIRRAKRHAKAYSEAMKPTNRVFKCVETGEKCDLFTSADGSKFHLIFQDRYAEVNGFYIAPNTGATIKLNTGRQIHLSSSQFYSLKYGEKIVGRKLMGMKRFAAP